MHTDNTVLAATFIYSMCLDLVVLLLSGYKILQYGRRSQLTTLLFKDGLIYFIVAFVLSILGSNCIILTIFAP